MTAVIEILSGDLEGRSYTIDEAPFTIGRKDDCAIVLPKKYVSRKHAEIVEKSGRYVVRGLSEKNPIVSEDREVEELELEDGDEFEICGIRFKFRSRGRGANREERAKQKVNALASGAAVGKTKGYRKDQVSRGHDDIEDGPLPGEDDEETKQYRDSKASGDGARGSRDSSAKDSSAKDSSAKDSSAKDSSAKDSKASEDDWRKDPKEGPRERIVFDDEPGDGDKSAKASGSGDDKEEKTDAIDISKFKPDDPFADKKKGLTPEEAAQREKFIRVLVTAGIAGIALAGALLWWINRPKPLVPRDLFLKPPTPVGETRKYSEPINEDDPPDVPSRETPLDGGATDIIQAEDQGIATVEWVVPDTVGAAYFLVRGIAPGETKFTLRSRGGQITNYHIVVEGVSKHDRIKADRLNTLKTLSPNELKKEIHDRVRKGEQLMKDSASGGPRAVRFPRLALHEIELAQDAVDVLTKAVAAQGMTDLDLENIRPNVRAVQEKADREWHNQINLKKKSYDDQVAHRTYDGALRDLADLLWLVGDECDPNYQRWDLLMRKEYFAANKQLPGGNFEPPGCIEEQR
jgi:pSer/pThr/pTyr-binding forkhead associated (FHA) protein